MVLYRIILYSMALYCILLYYMVLYCTVLNNMVLYCTIWYRIKLLNCIALYCSFLYCIVLRVRDCCECFRSLSKIHARDWSKSITSIRPICRNHTVNISFPWLLTHHFNTRHKFRAFQQVWSLGRIYDN